jgi:hypothetical protein
VQMCTLLNGLVNNPPFEEVFLKDGPGLGEQLGRPVRKNHANALYLQGNHVLGQFKVELLGRQMGQTFPAMNGGSNLWVGFHDTNAQARTGGVQRGRTATGPRTDDHDVHVVVTLSHASCLLH